jgi:ribosome recycling factor
VAENFGVGLELSGKVFSLKRKAFNRKERKDVAKNAKENLERVRCCLYNTIRIGFPEN